ncbi:MAG TPA: asparaginase [Gemmatimonadales bacterium]|nr:asparaginase [Gemmatimonadales bacterium]
MPSFSIISTRGDLVESVHRVSVAVVRGARELPGEEPRAARERPHGPQGGLVASAGDPEMVTYWRSAAKPFQALALVEDGAADRWKLSESEIALTCASHSSEKVHLEVTDGCLKKIGCTEADLACGPHPPLGAEVAAQVTKQGLTPTPRWSNCSGKHSGMLALARHHGWPTAGYNAAGHPVQERILKAVAEWTDIPVSQIRLGVDGCTAANFAVPLSSMARAYARLGASDHPAAQRLRTAMLAHPELIAGTGRPDTDLMRAYPGQLIVKVGAEGIFCASAVGKGVGIALKVEDGDMRSATIALVAVLDQVLPTLGVDGALASVRVPQHATMKIRNTRGVVTGEVRADGRLAP